WLSFDEAAVGWLAELSPRRVPVMAMSIDPAEADRFSCVLNHVPRATISTKAARTNPAAERADRPDTPTASVGEAGGVAWMVGLPDEPLLSVLAGSLLRSAG